MDTEIINLDIAIDPAKLREARGERKAAQIAATLGISKQYLSMIELGRRSVPSDVLVKMCSLYDVRDIFALTNRAENFFARD